MTTRRQRQPAPPPPSRPAREPWPEPAWSLPGPVKVSAYTYTLRQVAGWTLHLPPIQRGLVWTPDQQLALVRAMWSGLPIAPLVVWRPAAYDGRVRWLLDGQQRATAIGLDVRTAGGERRPAPPTRWDWRTGAWSLDVGEPSTLAGLTSWDWDAARCLPVGLELSTRAHGTARAEECSVHVVEIGAWGEPISAARLVEAFRALATPGVPWSEEDLAALGDAGTWEVRGWTRP